MPLLLKLLLVRILNYQDIEGHQCYQSDISLLHYRTQYIYTNRWCHFLGNHIYSDNQSGLKCLYNQHSHHNCLVAKHIHLFLQTDIFVLYQTWYMVCMSFVLRLVGGMLEDKPDISGLLYCGNSLMDMIL